MFSYPDKKIGMWHKYTQVWEVYCWIITQNISLVNITSTLTNRYKCIRTKLDLDKMGIYV